MNDKLETLLQRWREGSLAADELRTLTALLATPEARAALRRDWFLEAALPQSLAASSVAVRIPQPTLAARVRGWLAGCFSGSDRDETATLAALRTWARASFAALVLSSAAVVWAVWTRPGDTIAVAEPEPAGIAQLMLETQLTDSP